GHAGLCAVGREQPAGRAQGRPGRETHARRTAGRPSHPPVVRRAGARIVLVPAGDDALGTLGLSGPAGAAAGSARATTGPARRGGPGPDPSGGRDRTGTAWVPGRARRWG